MASGQSSSVGAKKGMDLVCNKSSLRGGALIGKMEAPKELHSGTIMSIIQKGCNLKGDIEVLDIVRNVFILKFLERSDYYRILRGRPWAFQTYLVYLQPWDDDMVLKEMNSDNAIKLGSSVGKVVVIEDPLQNEKLVQNFLRARVLISLNSPLVIGFWLPRDGKDDVWMEVKYERVPNFCFYCGMVGHEQRSCLATEEKVNGEASYGSWIKATPPKFIDELIVSEEEGWCEIWKKETTAHRLSFDKERDSNTSVRDSGRSFLLGGNNGQGKENAGVEKQTDPRGVDTSVLIVEKDLGVNLASMQSKGIELGQSNKAQKPVAIRFPKKHFYRISPRNKQRSKESLKPKSPEIKMKEAGGRRGQIIPLLVDDVSVSTAIVPCVPKSSISDVVGRLGNLKLKRSPPSIESP